jgi:hypothetical protein
MPVAGVRRLVFVDCSGSRSPPDISDIGLDPRRRRGLHTTVACPLSKARNNHRHRLILEPRRCRMQTRRGGRPFTTGGCRGHPTRQRARLPCVSWVPLAPLMLPSKKRLRRCEKRLLTYPAPEAIGRFLKQGRSSEPSLLSSRPAHTFCSLLTTTRSGVSG